MAKAECTSEKIVNPCQYLLELANAKDSNALHGDSFTPARVAEIARQCVAERNELLTACEQAKNFLQTDLVEPGRSVFWNLVAAIRNATEQAA